MFRLRVIGLIAFLVVTTAAVLPHESLAGSLPVSTLRRFGVPYADFPGPDLSKLPPFYQNLVLRLMLCEPAERPPLAFCFAPDTDEEIVRIVSQLIYGVDRPWDYQAGNRWSTTAHGGTGGQGDPITITYSFVPDGVNVPDGIGEGAAPNEIYARMNTLFGSEAAWKAKFAQVFDRWSQLCGIQYEEVADDGAALFGSAGVLGARGDVRICMKPLDGGSGVLAYNYFPNTGDMVLDRAENWASSSNNYRFMRNIVAHEHGHGIGLHHVCPVNQTKLLEPFLSTSFDGPRHDDVRGGQRHYGDAYEQNNTSASATDLGAIDGSFDVVEASSDDNSDTDWYRFSVGSGQQVAITLDVLGFTYLEGAQNGDGSCSPGTQINSLDDNNLAVRLYDATATILLAEAAAQPAGVDEVIPNTLLPVPGNYFVQVVSGTANAIQLYNLNLNVSDAAPSPLLTVESPNGGESWYVGSIAAISWSSVGLSGNVRIELNRAYPGGGWEQLFANTANDGTENWPVLAPPSSSCRVRVVSILNPAVGDTSNGNFSILTPSPVSDLVIRSVGPDILLDWSSTQASNYLIYSSLEYDGPFDTLEGSVPDNNFVHVGGSISAERRFYLVIAEYGN